MPYLPQWDKGQEVGTGTRDGNERYEAIRNYLLANDIGDNPTVLDFGAWNGYFSRRLAEDFDAHCTAVDDTPELQPYPGVTVINRRLPANEITETYDVVIAMSVMHHLDNWRQYLDAFLAAGKVVFLEVAIPDENLPKAKAHNNSKAIMRAVKAKKLGGTVIAETPGYDFSHLRPLIVIDQRPAAVEEPEVEEPQDN